VLEMDHQVITFKNRRATSIRRRKISPVFFTSLPHVDTDIESLRFYDRLLVLLGEKRRGRNKEAVHTRRIHALPRTFKNLQIVNGNLRMKRTNQPSGHD